LSATIAINKIHFPVTTLGYGRRVGIWTQGCSIHCPGCISRDTWDFDKNKSIAVEQLVESIRHWLKQSDGVTVSGGEPFDQPTALLALISGLRRAFEGDLLIYSCYPREKLFAEHENILNQVDVLISEPYESKSNDSLIWRGSDNQRITLLSEHARYRYAPGLDQQQWNGVRSLDVVIEDDHVWMAGIPRRGDMAKLKQKLAKSGYGCHASDETPRIRA
jgi:anaerobic ribonucleoside-triphosphate reductase activating protein